MASFKVEVLALGEQSYVGNGLRFSTKKQAEAYGSDLAGRWTAVDKWRVTPSEDEPNRTEE